jgi:hypothetical protein
VDQSFMDTTIMHPFGYHFLQSITTYNNLPMFM